MADLKPLNAVPGMEHPKTDIENIIIETAEVLEHAGQMLKSADTVTQQDEIRKQILDVEFKVRQFKNISGITFEYENTEPPKKPAYPVNHPLGYKRMGESSAHKSSGYPKKPV